MWDKQNICVSFVGWSSSRQDATRRRVTRDAWVNQKETLWSLDHTKVVAKGYILLAFPYEAIEFEELGDEHVGVTISKIHANLDKESNNIACSNSSLESMNVQLLRWPIKQVTFEDGSALLDTMAFDSVECQNQDFKLMSMILN